MTDDPFSSMVDHRGRKENRVTTKKSTVPQEGVSGLGHDGYSGNSLHRASHSCRSQLSSTHWAHSSILCSVALETNEDVCAYHPSHIILFLVKEARSEDLKTGLKFQLYVRQNHWNLVSSLQNGDKDVYSVFFKTWKRNQESDNRHENGLKNLRHISMVLTCIPLKLQKCEQFEASITSFFLLAMSTEPRLSASYIDKVARESSDVCRILP